MARKKTSPVEKNAVQISDESLEIIQTITHIGGWEYNLQTGHLIWTDELFRILGLDPKKDIPSKENFALAIYPADRELVLQLYEDSIKYHQVFDLEHRLLYPNGEIRFVHAYGDTSYDEENQPITNVGVLQDITEKKIADTQLIHKTRGLIVLSNCNEALVKIKEEKALLNEICRICVEEGGYRLAWIGLAEKNEKKNVRIAAQCGFDEGYLEAAKITWDESERGLGPVGTAIRTGQPCIIENVVNNPQFKLWRDDALKHGFCSVISLPIQISDETIGAITLYSEETNAFQKDEQNLLIDLAGDLSFGITAIRSLSKQRQLEEDLALSHSRFSQAQESAHIGNWEWDFKQDILYWSDEMYRLFDKSYTDSTHTLLSMLKCVHVDDRKKVEQALWGCVQSGAAFSLEFRILDSTLEEKWLESNGDLAVNETRSQKVVTGTMQDITSRKKAEIALAKVNQNYRLISDNTADVIWIWDIETQKYTFISPSVAKLHGISIEEALKKEFTEVLTPEAAQKVGVVIAQKLPLFIQGLPVEPVTLDLDQYRFDGTIIPTETTLNLARTGDGKIQIVGVSRDISERKKIQNELENSLLYMESAEKQTGLASWSLDFTTGSSWWSPQMYRTFGFDPANGVPPSDQFISHIHRQDQSLVAEMLVKIFQAEPPESFEFRTNPEILPLRILWPDFRFERDANGKPVKIFGTDLDITERKHVEEELRKANANYQLITENSLDVIWAVDVESQKYTYVSPSIYKLRGFTPEEMLQQTFRETMTPDSYNTVVEIIADAINQFRTTKKRFQA